VRSARPKERARKRRRTTTAAAMDGEVQSDVTKVEGGEAVADGIVISEGAQNGIEHETSALAAEGENEHETSFDPIKDELPYIALLNRVFPPDIRILAWCPHPPSNFDARFSCKERKYRYFFTCPAFLPLPGTAGLSPKTGHREGWLDIGAMQEAASYLVGTHDFRNFCKVDPTKQLTNFARRITDASVHMVGHVSSPDFVANFSVTNTGLSDEGKMIPMPKDLRLYSFDVQGSAFLWHQVRCMVAVLFLVGQGLEKPEVVKELLDVGANPRKPHYEMASDQPLVLWDCMFSAGHDKGKFSDDQKPKGYVDRGVGDDELEWIYAADTGPGTSNQAKWGPMGLMPDLWRQWRKVKIDEVLAAQLLDLVALQGKSDGGEHEPIPKPEKPEKENQRVFEGHDNAVPRGKYVPIMQKSRMDPVEVINARWAAKKGRPGRMAPPDRNEGDG
jgi:tRNA pseudouridine38/39 synthase